MEKARALRPVEDQAVGRAHRTQQRRPVTVHRFTVRSTIAEGPAPQCTVLGPDHFKGKEGRPWGRGDIFFALFKKVDPRGRGSSAGGW